MVVPIQTQEREIREDISAAIVNAPGLKPFFSFPFSLFFRFLFGLIHFLSILEQVSFVQCQEHCCPKWPASSLFLSSLPPSPRQSWAVGGLATSNRMQRHRGGLATARNKKHLPGKCRQRRQSIPMSGSSRAMLVPALRIKCGMTTPWSPGKFTRYVVPNAEPFFSMRVAYQGL
ncbi:hypothetical protein VTN31DRAFT_818 [Thermomyces dupontii]|uniref:uncharacterized protein n=1 Tax=Talaromyces thermophilus TaxID=28565 RepID=UPI0037449112